MKIVLLGAGGQLGREWCQFLSSAGTDADFKAYGSGEADITDIRSIRMVLNGDAPDLLINCAAYTDVDRAEREREQAERVNSNAVRELAGLCAELGIRLVHYSTDYVFPGREVDRRRWPEGYTEEHATEPVNWYGQTKLKGEQAVKESGAAYLMIRTSWLCGQYGSNFVKTMLRLSEERNRLEVVDDQWGSPSFTENVVFNSFRLIESGSMGIYHITSSGLITWYRLAKELFLISGIEMDVEPVRSERFRTEAKRPKFSKLSTRKLESVKGTEIETWQQGLRRLVHQLAGG